MEVKNQVRVKAIKVQLRIEVSKFCERLTEITPVSVKDHELLFYTEMDQAGLQSVMSWLWDQCPPAECGKSLQKDSSTYFCKEGRSEEIYRHLCKSKERNLSDTV